jgi:hypothetical protein
MNGILNKAGQGELSALFRGHPCIFGNVQKGVESPRGSTDIMKSVGLFVQAFKARDMYNEE